MRTSLTELKQIEDYLTGRLSSEEALVMKARLLTSPLLRLALRLQKKTYRLIRLYGRKQLRSEIRSVENAMFEDPGNADFQRIIFNLFIKQ